MATANTRLVTLLWRLVLHAMPSAFVQRLTSCWAPCGSRGDLREVLLRGESAGNGSSVISSIGKGSLGPALGEDDDGVIAGSRSRCILAVQVLYEVN
jgi:hypothetical protein